MSCIGFDVNSIPIGTLRPVGNGRLRRNSSNRYGQPSQNVDHRNAAGARQDETVINKTARFDACGVSEAFSPEPRLAKLDKAGPHQLRHGGASCDGLTDMSDLTLADRGAAGRQ